MTTVNDSEIRAFLAEEAGRASAAAPSLDEAVGRMARRIERRSTRPSHRLIVLLAATLLLAAALGTAIAIGSGVLRLPLVNEEPPTHAIAADVPARLRDFLQARVDGAGAEGYVDVVAFEEPGMTEDVPLLYATTSGAPYERFEVERVSGTGTNGDGQFKVRLFADGGETVVEQTIYLQDGDLTHYAVATRENGQPVAQPYVFFDGRVTVYAPSPWNIDPIANAALKDANAGRIEFVGPHPLSVNSECEVGLADADAETLAQSIGSDPAIVARPPAPVSVGGASGFAMDIRVAPGGSVCDNFPIGVGLDGGSRMRIYLLDIPEGIMGIAVVAPEGRFDEVVESATPVVDSLAFTAP